MFIDHIIQYEITITYVCQNSSKHQNKQMNVCRTSTIEQLNLIYNILALSVRKTNIFCNTFIAIG